MSTLLAPLAEAISTIAAEANKIASRVAAANEKQSGKLIHETIKTSNDPKVVKFREFEEAALAKVEAARKQVEEYVKATLVPTGETISDAELETLKSQHKDMRAKVKAATDLAKMQPDYTEEWLKSLPEMLTFRGNTGKASGSQTGIARPRLSGVKIDGVDFVSTKKDKDGNIVPSVTFTAVAAELVKRERAAGNKDCALTAADLFAAAEATNSDWRNASSVEFVYAGKTANYMLTVFPQQASE